MNSKVEITIEKRVFLKSFPKIKQIENVIKHICHMDIDGIQISVLGKLEGINLDTNFADSWTDLKKYCENELRLSSNFGMVSNPELGTFFIAGFLTPMFLQEINGKKIGSMSTGLYGILRGLGIDQNSVDDYSKALNQGNYLLIIRANKSELIKLEANLSESA